MMLIRLGRGLTPLSPTPMPDGALSGDDGILLLAEDGRSLIQE